MHPNNSSFFQFRFLEDIKTSLERQGFRPESLLKKFLWVFILSIIFIFFKHNSDKLVVRLEKDRREMNDVRATLLGQNSSYMFSSKHSEISKKLQNITDMSNLEPPIKIEVEE